ncbi:MAG: SH3 domain-containing protein [Planctomycetota bacterium]
MDRIVSGRKLKVFHAELRLSLTLLVCVVTLSTAVGQQFPYTAYVGDDAAYVRSGPGQRYYPTRQLPAGFAVEVYRHDDDGWCAIRPPEGSYSWVGSHQVQQVSEGVVEIVEDNVVTRVGSELSRQRSVVQVLLPKGERVQLLSAIGEEDPRWIRLAAPAGEFRWIAAGNLSRQPPIEAKPLPQPGGGGWSRQTIKEVDQTSAQQDSFEHLAAGANETNTGLQFAPPEKFISGGAESIAPTAADPNAMEVIAGSPAEMQLAQFQPQPSTPPLLAATPPETLSSPVEQATVPLPDQVRPRVRFRGLTDSAMSPISNVEEIELRLSQAVSQPPDEWELDSLKASADRLLTSTTAPSVRAQLREVTARIDRFQAVKRRYQDPGPTIIPERDPFDGAQNQIAGEDGVPRDLTGLSSTVRERIKEDLAEESSSARPTGRTAKVTEPLFAAAGMLKPVVSQRPKAPEFALVDDEGKVVSFITPTPDLDLQPYVGRRIGVHGNRGYMPEYRRAHVTAGRVTPLSDTVRR